MDDDVNISLLLPTRGRPALLRRLLDSVADTTANLRELEIVLYVDEDDVPSHEVSHPSLSLKRLIRSPGQTMGSMNQACYEESRGRYVMLLNDDVVFRTKHWDRSVYQAFAQFPDDIALVYGNDLHRKKSLATLPILSRTVCEILGGVCPKGYLNVYIDLHLFDLFKKLARLRCSRMVYLDDVVFEHMHHEAGKSVMDTTYVKKDERADDFLFISLEDERWNQAEMLRRYIETKNGGTSHDPGGSRLRALLRHLLGLPVRHLQNSR